MCIYVYLCMCVCVYLGMFVYVCVYFCISMYILVYVSVLCESGFPVDPLCKPDVVDS